METKTKKLWIHSIAASVVAVLLSLFGYALNHSGLHEGLFLLVPFCTGLTIAFMSKGKKVVAITAMTSLLLSLTILLITGLEGVACVVMAFPILFVSIGLGSLVGFLIGRKFLHRYGNITIIVFCLALMSLAGWTNRDMKEPQSLQVRTSMNFYAPMQEVWSSVTGSVSIEGDDTALRLLGLPVPSKCTLDSEGTCICFFEDGEIVQEVTANEFGKVFEVRIVDALEVRHWLSFDRAGYEFIQHDEHVEVIRTDIIVSTLRPRWYWHWFEERCVQLEHRYVMSSMKTKAEL